MLTEQEWRKQAEQKRTGRAGCWGAQYVIPRRRLRPLRPGRALGLLVLLAAAGVSAALPAVFPRPACESFAGVAAPAQQQPAPPSVQPRQVEEIVYAFPAGVEGMVRTYTRTQLLHGSMMLLDEAHPLPADAPAPNTMSAALYGKGRIPVRSLQVRSGLKTLDALTELFALLDARGVTGLCVWEGTLSRAEQRDRMVRYTRQLMCTQTAEAAVQAAHAAMDLPGKGELVQEYGVELRFRSGQADAPQQTPLEETLHGQHLLQTAWRCGFIRPEPNAQGKDAFRFRWVGRAHAAAMTYLQLSLKDYLLWMHEKGVLTLWEGGTPKYVIVCAPMDGEEATFLLPQDAACEVSLDNMGYALAVAELP